MNKRRISPYCSGSITPLGEAGERSERWQYRCTYVFLLFERKMLKIPPNVKASCCLARTLLYATR